MDGRLDRPAIVGASFLPLSLRMSTASGIQELARLAGIELPEERAAPLIPSQPALQDAARALAAVDYGDVEPSGRFRSPGSVTK